MVRGALPRERRPRRCPAPRAGSRSPPEASRPRRSGGPPRPKALLVRANAVLRHLAVCLLELGQRVALGCLADRSLLDGAGPPGLRGRGALRAEGGDGGGGSVGVGVAGAASPGASTDAAAPGRLQRTQGAGGPAARTRGRPRPQRAARRPVPPAARAVAARRAVWPALPPDWRRPPGVRGLRRRRPAGGLLGLLARLGLLLLRKAHRLLGLGGLLLRRRLLGALLGSLLLAPLARRQRTRHRRRRRRGGGWGDLRGGRGSGIRRHGGIGRD